MSRDKKKVLVTGANGQLGEEVVSVFSKDLSYLVLPKTHQDLDITNKKQVRLVLQKEKPDIIIHCAAWTNVDTAAQNPKAAMKVNGEGTKNICEAGKEIGSKVVYVSTAEVFDGEGHAPYVESDKPSPINTYAKSKRQGEIYCQEILGRSCLIVRPSWLYGPESKNNFPTKILNLYKKQGFLKVVDDEVGVPTYAPDVAEMIYQLVKRKESGIYHTTNKGSASRYAWTKKLLSLLDFKDAKIKPIKLKDFKRASTPPAYSVLALRKIEKLGIKTRRWEKALSDYIKSLNHSEVVSKVKVNNL